MGKNKIITLDEALAASRKEMMDLWAEHVNPPMAKLLRLMGGDILHKQAEGPFLFDGTRRYLDLTGGYGSLNLGHNPKEVLEAVAKTAMLPRVLLAGCNPLAGALASNLTSILPRS